MLTTPSLQMPWSRNKNTTSSATSSALWIVKSERRALLFLYFKLNKYVNCFPSQLEKTYVKKCSERDGAKAILKDMNTNVTPPKEIEKVIKI